MDKCTLCPRDCGAKRAEETGLGYCGMGTLATVARAAPHFWEEPCVSGTYGCGAVFFAGCTLHCTYCQNMAISRQNQGKRVSARELADIFMRLEDENVHALELVTGTQFIPAILDALSLYRPRLPLVWNTSGYETVASLRRLEGLVDVYLPDLKHVSSRLSAVCAGAPDYFRCAGPALEEMCRQIGPAQYDAEGIMTRGTLVRHLVLPGCTGDSLKVLDFIHDHLPGGTPISLMRQYTPQPHCTKPPFDRRVRDKEYARVLDYAAELGLEGYMQDKHAADSAFIPPFDLTGMHAQPDK
ncbi:MAG: 4Fe-4S cluster-binding domain-containing protein [Eubacteriales bacterium]|nr:4Fe-4S cluster-binding domain-containing protein [Eubacteriales bacterium]MDD4104935.1 4Fe-4S cluster-binding domain-containing protein [Eubacteriales bacterium]MDD4710089.1 4Fe-4S cluster-binding domain-containing protein [Eubacteriales bacterium]NLO15993.1 4Fe-4S cluster-binding domain-containing protein [Clostridiales bacterium]